MRYLLRLLAVPLFAGLVSVSCIKEPEEAYSDVENRSLRAWMLKNKPELVENFQTDGEYYVEVLDPGVADSLSINEILKDEKQGSCWLFYNMTGRDLHGQVCITRSEPIAQMQGTFTKYTHYVPYLRYIGDVNISLMEGTYLAMKSVLTLGEKYAADHGLSTEFEVRYGTSLRLYLPSSIVNGAGGVSGTGGYEGEYELDGNRPMIMDFTIVNRVNNPLAYEGDLVDAFGEGNGGVTPIKKDESEDTAESALRASLRRVHTRADGTDSGLAWRHAYDTIPGLLVYPKYVPDAERGFDYAFRYLKSEEDETPVYGTNEPYFDSDVYAGGPTELDKKINAALVERFGQGTYGDTIGTDKTARIWYICRFLDGFIADTNIDEVKEIIYGSVESEGSVMSYSPESDKDDVITAWYYTVPQLCFGQWAAFVTTSSFAYGTTGQSGSSETSSSSSSYYNYYNYYNFYNYYNSYYGNLYYNNYYYNYYNNYYYNNYYDTSDTTTITTVTTEIQAYTPLLFQIYIEEAD